MSLTQKVLTETNETESPAAFYYWATLVAIAATARKKIYVDRFVYKLYPNLYVLLIGKSGMRKGAPVTFCKRVVEEAGTTRVISGRNTIEAILKELSKIHRVPNQEVVKEAHGLLVSSELAGFLIQNPQALTILTDLYNSSEHEKTWKNSLKNTGVEVLHAPCLSLIGASNETHLESAVPEHARTGGFIGRTVMVLGDKRRGLNPLMEAPVSKLDESYVVDYLREVQKLNGPMHITKNAKDLYTKWYTGHMNKRVIDSTGTNERVHDTILKVATCISLANGFDLTIREPHMDEAISVCEDASEATRLVIMGSGANTLAKQTKQVVRLLVSAHEYKLPRQVILRRLWGEIDTFELDRIVATLVASGVARMEPGSVVALEPATIAEFNRITAELA